MSLDHDLDAAIEEVKKAAMADFSVPFTGQDSSFDFMKRHWYTFTFVSSDVFASINVGRKESIEKLSVTNSEVKSTAKSAKVSEHAVLLGISYRGYCTKEEFES